jgi:hypothetical protein
MKLGTPLKDFLPPNCRGGCSYRFDKETLRVLRQPKGRRLTSSDLRPFEARITTTRKGQRHRAHHMFARLELYAIASTTNAMGRRGLQTSDVAAMKKDTAVTGPAEASRRLRVF